jgi:hypothetical protein
MVSRVVRGSLTQEISGFDAQACPLRHLPAPSMNVGGLNIRINEGRFGVFIAWKADEDTMQQRHCVLRICNAG